jgi:Bifunctional DNA primase/polymerase, N-terminal
MPSDRRRPVGVQARCNRLSSLLVQNWNRRTAVELALRRPTIDLDRRRVLESRLRELRVEEDSLEAQDDKSGAGHGHSRVGMTTSTAEIVHARGWKVVRLRGKKPIGAHWQVTKDPDEITAWLDAGSNIGLVCHERTGVAVLDPDNLLAWADMIETLGQPSLPWVVTGSGRLHYYVVWEPDLPAKLTWRGEVIGEIQRGPGQQQVVLPPSRHPDTGAAYRWIDEFFDALCEPLHPLTDPLPRLPGIWLAYLRAEAYEREYRNRQR